MQKKQAYLNINVHNKQNNIIIKYKFDYLN